MSHSISDVCIACGSCISECPVNAISEGNPYKIDSATCTDCGSCASSCPTDAISSSSSSSSM
jgi:ferredoxin